MIIETNGRRRSQAWWLPSGISETNVQAAYQFKGATSESNAYYNLVNSSTSLFSKFGVIDLTVCLPTGKPYTATPIKFSSSNNPIAYRQDVHLCE